MSTALKLTVSFVQKRNNAQIKKNAQLLTIVVKIPKQ